MPSWKKVVAWYGDPQLNSVTSTTYVSASEFIGPLVGTSSFATSASYAVFATTAGTASYSPTLGASLGSPANNQVSLVSSTGAVLSSVTINNVTSASYALTASYAENVPTALTASYALTASSANDFNIRGSLTGSSANFSGNVTASNLLVQNTITANRLVVQVITSSTEYVTGSTIFGSSLSNTHEFTGSVTITGSFAVNGIDYETTSASFDQRILTNSSSIALLSSSFADLSGSFATGSFTGSFSGSFSGSFRGEFSGSLQNLRGQNKFISVFSGSNDLTSSIMYQSGSGIAINETNFTSANPEALYVFQTHPTSINVISGKGNINNYLQLNVQNTNQGISASSDIVATANNGNEFTNYIDMGINSENYAIDFIGGPNDAYLYNTGSNLHIGNASENGSHLGFFVGGTNTDTYKKLQLNPTGPHEMTGSLRITGSLTVTNGITGSLFGTSSWAVSASNAPNYTLTSSFTQFTQSYYQDSGSFSTRITNNSSSIATLSSSFLNASASFDTRILNVSSSVATLSSSFLTTSASYASLSGSFRSGSYTGSFTGSFLGTASYAAAGNGPFSGSFSGSFFGNGAGITNISASSVVGLNLSLISSGSVTASTDPAYGFKVNSNAQISGSTQITGSLGVTGSVSFSGSAGSIFSANVDTLVFTGSFFQTGSMALTGSLNVQGGITGSLLGTSSYALSALSSSYALSASYAPTSVTASYSLFALTASNALTASSADNFFVRGDVTGSNAVFTGTITAQTLNVQVITSSVDFVTGSTRFGSQLTDTHQFTGSVSITGSLQVNGPATINNLTGSLFGTSSYAETASLAIISTYTSEWILGSVGSSDYTFTGPGFTGSGIDPAIYLVRGQQYKFTNTMGAHPFRIQTTPNGSVGPQYNNGVTNNDVSNGTLTFNVPMDAPEILYYQCTAHASMGGPIYILDQSPISSSYALSASFADSATSASFASNTTSASYAINATTASYALNAELLDGRDSSVFATTGSNVFIGNQTVTGSLFTSGSNTLIGSTTLTGSLNITGSTVQVGNNTLLGNTTLSGSLTISGSQGVSTPTINIFGDIEQTGYTRFLPVTTNINTSISASYIYVSGSTNDLYFSQNGAGYNNVTRLRWLEGNLYTGLLNGGVITTQSSTVYQISSGSGIIVDLNASLNDNPYPTVQYLNWGNLSASIAPLTASYQQAFVGIDSTGNIFAQGTPFSNGQFDTLINIGNVLFQNQTTINGVKTQPSVAYGFEQAQNVFNRAFGPLKLSGYTLAPSGSSTGSLVVGSGTAYSPGANYTVDPNEPYYSVDNGTSVSKIFRYYQSGSTWVYLTNAGAGFLNIDPSQYSNNGTLTSVGAGNWSVQRAFWFPNSVTKAIVVYYGNQIYATEAEAIANISFETFVEAPNTAANAIYLGAIIISGNGVFTNGSTYSILPGGLFRQVGGSGGGGSLVTQTLSGLSDVAISGPTDLQPLAYSTTAAKWINTSTLSASIAGNATTATTASFAATASYVLLAVSASYATTASYVQNAQSASYVLNAVSASYASQALSASHAITSSYALQALTASNALTASSADNFVVRGNITGSNAVFTGTITAQTLYVQDITSSVDFVTGSTKFGTQLTDTHQFTGSVTITGSLSVNNSPVLTQNQTGSLTVLSASYATTASYVENAQSASYVLNAVSSSYALTASYAANVPATASYALQALSSSYSDTASLATTASYAVTAAYAANVPATASYALQSLSSSYALTASFALNAGAGGISAVTVADEGIIQGSASFFDFVGATVTTSVTNGTASINIAGGAVAVQGAASTFTQSVAATTWSLNHAVNSRTPVVEVYDSSYNVIIPTKINNPGPFNTDIYFDVAQSGYAIISTGGVFAVSGSNAILNQTVAATTWSFQHDLQTRYPVFTIFDSNNDVIIPQRINAVDTSSAIIYFSTARTGKAVASVAGPFTFAQSASVAISASYASQALSSSYAITASYAGFAQTIASGLDITASNLLVNNSATASNLLVNNSITASSITAQSASFGYVTTVTGSAVIIGQEFIILNTQAPASRYAGLKIYDSGSNSTASIVWDSQTNHFVYENGSGSSYSGAGFLAGPRNTGSLADITYPTQYKVLRSQGDDHVYDSNITDNDVVVSIGIGTNITGSLVVSSGITGSLLGTASFANQASTASYVQNAQTASYVLIAVSASYATTASYVENAQSASYVLNAVSASYSLSSSQAVSSSYSVTASYAANVPATASYALQSLSSSYALTASFALNGGGGGLSALYIQDEGATQGTASYIDFTGAGVSATVTNGTASINIPGGGGGGTSGLSTTFTQSVAADPWTFVHNLNTRTPLVQVYDTSYNQITPQYVSASNANTVIIGFGVATAGYAVASNGGTIIVTGSNVILDQQIAATTWSFDHNLNTQYPVFQVFNTNNEVIVPEKIVATTTTSSFIYFPLAIAGKAVASVGGLSGSISASYAINALSSSYALSALSSSYALTASFALNGGGGGISAISVADEGTLIGTASYFDFIGNNISASVNNNTASITIIGATGTSAFTQSTAAATWSFVHNLNTFTPLIQAYTSTYNQLIPNEIVGIDPNIAEIRFDYSQSGYAIASNGGALTVSGSTARLDQTSTAVTWSFAHNLNSQYLNFEIYDTASFVIIPAGIKAVNSNNAEIYFASPTAGTAIAMFSGINGAPNATTASFALSSSNFVITNTLRFNGTLNDSATVNSSVVGSNNLFTQATASFTSAFFKYTAASGSNARSGEVMAVWNGASVEFTDTSTVDIGTTSQVTASVALAGGDVQFNMQTNGSGWRIKSLATFI